MDKNNNNVPGKGRSPLNVRRSIKISERIEMFIDKILKIDSQYMPDSSLLLSIKESDRRVYKKANSIWVQKVREAVRTERKYLGAEGTAEAKDRPRIRMDTYRVRMSMYRSAFYKRVKYVNPELKYKGKKLIESSLLSPLARNIVEKVITKTDNDKATKYLANTLEDNTEKLTDTEYRLLRDLKKYMDHPVISSLSVSERVSKIVKKNAKESLVSRHKESVRRIRINLYISWMRRVLNNYKEHDWENLAIALALATGRRPYELFCVGKFTKPDGNILQFDGQAKKHMNKGESYPIPLLHDAKRCKEVITRMRKSIGLPTGINNVDFNSKTAKPLATRMDYVFGKEKIEFYGLRAAYARYCVQNLYESSLGTEEVYLSSILGHESDDLVTVQHYKTVLFDEEFSLAEAQLHWKQVVENEEKKKLSASDEATQVYDKLKDMKPEYKGARLAVFEFIKKQAKKGNNKITQSFISKEGGFSRPAIKDVLADLDGILNYESKGGAERESFLLA